ncbi:hypothetical protein IMSHALPRED_008376 [Imshaugia aleurites]|uniref:Mitochondrial carrier protein n=1 Tax=Imshaugia aleurites TaxID=172621 RepID=A0A8H3EPZ6_9LECA|nr:hypothetical protein IMSHALPRED_008376 [Imshaugia aleurites]
MSFNNTNTDILIAGAFAAFTVDVLVYPLDTIKTRLQSPDYKRLYTKSSTNALPRSLFRGLYQGIGSVILATIPSSGAFFTTYEGTKSILSHTSLPTPITHSVASSAGELVSCFILTPAEVLKQNAQMVSHPQRSPSSNKIFEGNATILALRKFNSPTQLWRGYTALAGRNLPFTAMQFPMFEHLRTSIQTYRKRKGIATGSMWEAALVTAVSAALAGSVAAVITTPIDVVKTRIMLSAADSDQPRGETQQKAVKAIEAQGRDAKAEIEKAQQAARGGRAGGLAVGREIWRTEGVKGLFRGGALRGVWTALGSGLYLGVYESGRRYLEGRRVGVAEGLRVE